jgi:hypothetical protein
MQEKFDEEKEEIQQSKEQLFTKKLEVKDRVNKEIRFVTLVEFQTEDQVPQQVAQFEEVI